jgi:type IV pilus assembly protein PilX
MSGMSGMDGTKARPLGAWRRRRQGGVALLTALLLMLAVLMTGIAAARTAISGARAAGHERDRMLARQAAMAALADAEHDIEGGADPASSRATALAGASPAAFAGGCRGGAPYEGLCSHVAGAGAEVLAALADAEGPGIALGRFTGASIPSGAGALASQAPRYLIELMPSPSDAILYRITALGFGRAQSTQVAVQAYYRKLVATAAPPGASASATPAETGDSPTSVSPPLPGTPGGPGVRVGWREISNWHDAVAAISS